MLFWEFLLLILACAGLTTILVHGKIVEIPRKYFSIKYSLLRQIFKCSMCMGWWVGIYGLIVMFLYLLSPYIFYCLTFPFASSAVSFLYERFVVYLDNKNIQLEDDISDIEDIETPLHPHSE